MRQNRDINGGFGYNGGNLLMKIGSKHDKNYKNPFSRIKKY